IFCKRKWLILSIIVAVVALNAVRTMMQIPIYAATVRVQIDPTSNLVGRDGSSDETSGGTYDFIAAQLQILQSHMMAERVTSILKLGEDPSFFKPRSVSIVNVVRRFFSTAQSPAGRGAADRGAAARQEAASNLVAANVTAYPVHLTRLIDITYSDPDPGR